jgi:hypothetical protein
MASVRVCWEDHHGISHNSPARMEDTSPSGACLRLKTSISVGSKVRISWFREKFSGVTRYCRSNGADYVLGIQRDMPMTHIHQTSFQSTPFRPTLLHAAPIRDSATTSSHPFPALNNANEPAQPPIAHNQFAKTSPALRTVPIAHIAPSPAAAAPEIPAPATPGPADPAPIPQDQEPDTLRGAEPPTQQPSPRKETTRMPSKWLAHAPWRQKQDAPNGNSTHMPVPVPDVPVELPPTEDAVVKSSWDALAGAPGDLLTMDDVYRAAGILNPRMGYTVLKVADMLVSDHIRGLSDNMKRASVLMALDAAGVLIEDVMCDAALRQDAVESYESSQRKHFEEFWARKDEENSLIRAELERATAQYLHRIKRNLDEIAHEKAAFAAWQSMKQREVQRISEAMAVCAKPASLDAPAPPAPLEPPFTSGPPSTSPPSPPHIPHRGQPAAHKPS